ncbi:MAG TPA: DUF6600 domain-containing protein [Acetobacteraceae bacterium]|nr:DUF6600 domain-containing protein [Acetobacteraceae bacterium]
MRPHSLVFRLSAATAVAGLMLAQVMPQAALAQPVPPGAAPAVPGQEAGNPPERAGWLAQIAGAVSFHTADADQWSPAGMNYPVASGDAFWTEPDASARIVVSDSRIALAGGTELDVGTLDAGGLQATVPQGEIYLRLRDLTPGETWSVQTPRGLVTISGAGRYDVAAGDTQDPTLVTVLDGVAQVTGPGLSLQVGPGQTATITGTDTFEVSVGPARMDGFLTAMLRAERPPSAPANAPPPVVAQMPGGDDLSAYGTWSQTSDYGDVWYPQVAPGWMPYREGRWAYVRPWGWTWVDDAPWGFAPFHYGRWLEVRGRWGWTPGVVAVAGPPVYAPALVAFIGIGVGVGIGEALASGRVGWVPLGPREAYHPWYHSSEAYLRAVNRRDVTNVTVINNRNVTINNFVNRGAATVVPASAMAASRPVRQVAERVDPRMLATARPVIGTSPIRPTAATAGITPRLARQMHLAPAPAGVAAVPRAAPGPAIHAVPAQGVAARPTLRHAAGRPGVAPEHGGARPGVVPPPAAMPILRTPAGREGAPPPIVHAAPGREAVTHGATSTGAVRPGLAPAGSLRPGPTAPLRPAEPQVVHPTVAPPRPVERPVLPRVEPRAVTAPAPRAPTALRTAPLPQVHYPAPQTHAVPRPQVHAPAPQMHVAPLPQVHAPAPQMHAAPRPQVHAPAPQMHAAPRPQVHAAPRPQVHAPAPQMHVAPRPQVHAPAPQMHAVPRPQVHAPAPQMHAAPRPQVHAAPAPHPAPAAREAKKPGEH